MKLLKAVGVWVVAGTIVSLSAASRAAAPPDEQTVKAPDGSALAVVVLCRTCREGGTRATKQCHTGEEKGWIDGRACGECLLHANPAVRFNYPYDIHITGKLTDAAGKPLKDRFVKLFMANGWSVRTKTYDQGLFRVRLGAIAARKSQTPVVIDIGTRVDLVEGKDANYSLYLLPPGYRPCAAGDQQPETPHRQPPKEKAAP